MIDTAERLPTASSCDLVSWLEARGVRIEPEDGPDLAALEGTFASSLGARTSPSSPPRGWRGGLAAAFARHAIGPRPSVAWSLDRLSGPVGDDGAVALVLDASRLHAFDATLLVALLRRARAASPLPSSSFAWVRAEDECLWHALDGCLRKESHRIEAIGIASHLTAEEAVGGRLEDPFMDPAVDAIVSFLADCAPARPPS
jgi:hypothetical protein